jgi:hypothetical protein
MSANTSQHVSMKDKLRSHLPGHKNQDSNANGIPDRLEKNSALGTTAMPLGTGVATPIGVGTAVVPGVQATTTITTTTKELHGRPISGNVLNDKVIQQETISTEPAMVQTMPVGQPIQQQFVDVREAPVFVEKIEKPAVIHEVIRTEEVVEVQPVIERERERLDVYEVVQPIREREVVATEVRTAVLPQQTRATVVADQSAFLAQRAAPGEFSTREVAPTLHQTVQNAPIVHETIIHKVVEEVQPVIYKEIDRPVLIKETLPIYEKIVEAPQAHHTVLPMRDLGTRTVMGTDFNRNGIPDQLEGYRTTGLQSGLTSTGTFTGQQGFQQGGFNDLNRNGIPDNLERQGFAQPGYASGLAQPGFVQPGLAVVNVPTETVRETVTTHVTTTTGDRIGRDHNLTGGLNDRNRNGIPDNLEKGTTYNNSGLVDDSLERRMGTTSLNSNRL